MASFLAESMKTLLLLQCMLFRWDGNVYAKLVAEEFKKDSQSSQSASKNTEESDEITFQEACKIVIASSQIVYNKWWIV